MWLKHALDSLNNIKDPFIKFIIRAILFLIFIALAFLIGIVAYSLITGKHIKVASQDYGIDSPPIVSSTKTEKKIKLDSPKRDTTNPKIKKKSVLHKSFVFHPRVTMKAKSIDTVKPIAPTSTQSNTNSGINSGNIGNNGHVVNGANFGVNGDLNINQEKKLSDQNLNELFEIVENLVKQKGFDKDGILVFTETYCNAPGIQFQVINYFKNKGYTLDSGVQAGSGKMVDGLKIDTSNRFSFKNGIFKKGQKSIIIMIGYFK